jgi:hypothetical protein
MIRIVVSHAHIHDINQEWYASLQAYGYLRESPSKNCSVGNTAQLGMAGRAGGIVTVFDEAKGLLVETACAGFGGSGLCLVRKTHSFCAIFVAGYYKKWSFYQDRLGTNIGKALQTKTLRFLQGVVGTSSQVELMSCSATGAQGWKKETAGHRADPFELFSWWGVREA